MSLSFLPKPITWGYPSFARVLLLQIPQDKNPQKYAVSITQPLQIWKGYEKDECLWLPKFVAQPSGTIYENRRARHVRSILEMVKLVEFQDMPPHWEWFGATKNGFPVVTYNRRHVGALKVLLGICADGEPGDIVAKKLCGHFNCICPWHYDIQSVYNTPMFQSHPGHNNVSYWKNPSLLPWQVHGGIEAFEKDTAEVRPLVSTTESFEDLFGPMVKSSQP